MENTEEEEDKESYCDSNDYISGPSLSKFCSIPYEILTFDYSYGYDCRKYFNLSVLDSKTVVFSSGNYLHFFNVESLEMKFRRSALGGGIGHISTNPAWSHLAVAECGDKPLIIIYEWPSLEIVSVLKRGAAKKYTYISYSPEGDKLVSQAGDPDYMLTIWDWKNSTILLRSKSYVNDVFRANFSCYIPEQLTTCGVGHIKFWEMANTFRGLKLEGTSGRFGKTEYSDIFGALAMPDGKVVSGCEWGNMLVWEDSLIKLQVYRSLRKPCHDAPIVQFFYLEGELWTVSMDGHVKVWWYDKIDQADPVDEDRVCFLEPSHDFNLEGLFLMGIAKQYGDPKSYSYFAQDGNGGIFWTDLNREKPFQAPKELFKGHGGKIMDLEACPFNHYFLTLGEDGFIFLYNYQTRLKEFSHKFPAKGRCLLWFPVEFQQYGDHILIGFDDGQIRLCLLMEKEDFKMLLIQVLKPHSKPIVAMSLNVKNNILISASEDSTIFIFKLLLKDVAIELVPIGYFPTADIVTCIIWETLALEEEPTVILACKHGHIMLVTLPKEPQDYTEKSFLLKLQAKYSKFQSCKSAILRKAKEENKKIKMAKKLEEFERLKRDNPELQIDEELILGDLQEEEESEPLYIPETPNDILWIKYTPEKTLWVSMKGYDAGFLYEYKEEDGFFTPLKQTPIFDAEDTQVNSYVYTKDEKYLFFAMEDGAIRINRVKEDYNNLCDYWMLHLHDNFKGFIPKMCFSYDESHFFTCGYDGNIFLYMYNENNANLLRKKTPFRENFPKSITDEAGYSKLSMEQTKLKAENDRLLWLGNSHKAQVKAILTGLKIRYDALLLKNETLKPSQVIPLSKLELDGRLNHFLNKIFQDNLDLVKRKMAYNVKKSCIKLDKARKNLLKTGNFYPIKIQAINQEVFISSFGNSQWPDFFDMFENEMEQKLFEEQVKEDNFLTTPSEPEIFMEAPDEVLESPRKMEYFLSCLSPGIIEAGLGPQLSRHLQKYRKRREAWNKRASEWTEFLAKRPIPGQNHPEDELLLKKAESSIGNYKLKYSADYSSNDVQPESTLTKFRKLLKIRRKCHLIQQEYTEKVFKLRDRKAEILEYLEKNNFKLNEIHKELPLKVRREGPFIPKQDSKEFPHLLFDVFVKNPELEEVSTEVKVLDEQFFVQEPTNNQIELNLLPVHLNNNDDGSMVNNLRTISDLPLNQLINMSLKESGDTPYEAELRKLRLNNKIFYQMKIINEMNSKIDDFNYDVQTLAKQRIQNLVDCFYLELHTLKIFRKILIIIDVEKTQNRLTGEVAERSQKLKVLKTDIKDLEEKIEARQNTLNKNQTTIKEIEKKFIQITKDNTFFAFLKRVFKKKFKEPKEKYESSSSSSEDSQNSDNDSIDSKDVHITQQDLNVCPKGCDVSLFNLTLDLREKRYKIEKSLSEEINLLEVNKKELETYSRRQVHSQDILEESKVQLEKIMVEKQFKLNGIRCCVVLNLNQLQSFAKDTKIFNNVENVLLFSKKKLSGLYKRVGELQMETFNQKSKQQLYVQHLALMKRDNHYMDGKIQSLKHEIHSQMVQKFGNIQSEDEIEKIILQRKYDLMKINDLEETVMKKLILELRLKFADVKEIYIQELSHLDQNLDSINKQLIELLKVNTKKMELCTIINKEKYMLQQLVSSLPKKKEQLKTAIMQLKDIISEIVNLERIVNNQNLEMEELKDEIKKLKTKGFVLKSIEISEPEHSIEEREPEDAWIDYDEYLATCQVEKKTELKILTPRILECEDIIETLLVTILKNTSNINIQEIVTKICCNIMQSCTIQKCVDEITSNLPIASEELDQTFIKEAASKLYKIISKGQLLEDDMETFCHDMILEAIDESETILSENMNS